MWPSCVTTLQADWECAPAPGRGAHAWTCVTSTSSVPGATSAAVTAVATSACQPLCKVSPSHRPAQQGQSPGPLGTHPGASWPFIPNKDPSPRPHWNPELALPRQLYLWGSHTLHRYHLPHPSLHVSPSFRVSDEHTQPQLSHQVTMLPCPQSRTLWLCPSPVLGAARMSARPTLSVPGDRGAPAPPAAASARTPLEVRHSRPSAAPGDVGCPSQVVHGRMLCPAGRAGACPMPGGSRTCLDLCSLDEECPWGHKCCSNGCGHVCMRVPGGKGACGHHRPPGLTPGDAGCQLSCMKGTALGMLPAQHHCEATSHCCPSTCICRARGSEVMQGGVELSWSWPAWLQLWPLVPHSRSLFAP